VETQRLLTFCHDSQDFLDLLNYQSNRFLFSSKMTLLSGETGMNVEAAKWLVLVKCWGNSDAACLPDDSSSP